MSLKAFRYLLVIPFCCTFTGMCAAPSAGPQAGLALEFPSTSGFPPIYATIPEPAPNSSPCRSFFYQGDLKRLSNAATGMEQPSALRWEICIKGDTILITPIVLYGASGPEQAMVPLEKIRHQTLATHSGVLNDSVAFPEMEQVGLEPLTLRIVTARPEHPYQPLTRSDAPSVQIEYAPFDRTSGTLTLHNLSGNAVDAFRVGSSRETGSRDMAETTIASTVGLCTLIAPGATYEEHISIPQPGKTVDGVFVENLQPGYLTLQAVLFADGSYEGDEQFAAEMAAHGFGAKVQHQRVEQLAKPILAEDGPDEASKIERIRNAIQQLSTQADPETIAQFHAQFPAFQPAVLTNVDSELSNGMKNAIELIDEMIKINERLSKQNQKQLTLARWRAVFAECQ
jgi:hypothetical protein